jgi:hypothetical protein
VDAPCFGAFAGVCVAEKNGNRLGNSAAGVLTTESLAGGTEHLARQHANWKAAKRSMFGKGLCARIATASKDGASPTIALIQGLSTGWEIRFLSEESQGSTSCPRCEVLNNSARSHIGKSRLSVGKSGLEVYLRDIRLATLKTEDIESSRIGGAHCLIDARVGGRQFKF